MYVGKKRNTDLGLGESAVLSLCQKLKDTYYVFFDNCFISPILLVTLLQVGIYATGTVRAQQKAYVNLETIDKEMKWGEHNWFSAAHLSAIKWMDNKLVILLSNYLNPKEMQQIDHRAKRPKDKVKVACPNVIHEYNQIHERCRPQQSNEGYL